jgi:SOS-response transcriptional repressor LexA
MDTVTDRISKIVAFKRWKQVDLAKNMQITPTSVSAIIKRKTQPSYDSLQNLLKNNPDISAAWLMTGSGSMLAHGRDPAHIPILGEIAAGNPIDFTPFPDISTVPLPINASSPTQYKALKVYGDSMAPFIIHNDIVVIHTVFDPWELDTKIVAIKIDTETTLKQMSIDYHAHQSILIPFNAAHYKPIILNSDSPPCQILGYVVSITRIL